MPYINLINLEYVGIYKFILQYRQHVCPRRFSSSTNSVVLHVSILYEHLYSPRMVGETKDGKNRNSKRTNSDVT